MLDSKHDSRETITLTRYKHLVRQQNEAECPQCGAEMDIHQPDIDAPSRVLGTCPQCAQWVLIDYTEPHVARVVELPRVEALPAPRLARMSRKIGVGS